MEEKEEFEEGILTYIQHLRGLPFVERVLMPATPGGESSSEPDFLLKTPSGFIEAEFKWSKSHLSRQMVEHMLRLGKGAKHSLFVLAPQIGGETARQFEAADINYVDRAGNCHVRLGDQYFAHIEGRSPQKLAPKQRSLRPASLRVLFTLLADSGAIERTVRDVALRSGEVSPQTVTDLRKRLAAEGFVRARGRRYSWTPDGKEGALDLLLSNYDVLAHKLIRGRYRTRATEIGEVEAELANILGEQKGDWWWGGGAAMHRQTGYYRGTQTLVYTNRSVASMGASLRLPPSEAGNVVIADLPGSSALLQSAQTKSDRTVHPLLVYLDLMSEGEERARDAAAEVRRTLFAEDEE